MTHRDTATPPCVSPPASWLTDRLAPHLHRIEDLAVAAATAIVGVILTGRHADTGEVLQAPCCRHLERYPLDVLVRAADGTAVRPWMSVCLDRRTRTVLHCHLSVPRREPATLEQTICAPRDRTCRNPFRTSSTRSPAVFPPRERRG